MFSTEIEDLKMQIFMGKRHNLKLLQENNAMKVKYRKLEAAISHRNRMIDSLINGKQPLIGKNMIEFSASILVKLKEENEDLKIKVMDQERIIKKLRQEVEASKLYIPSFSKNWSGPIKTARSCASAKPDIDFSKPRSIASFRVSEETARKMSLSETRSKSKIIELEIPAITLKNTNEEESPHTVENNESEYSEIETDEEGEIKTEHAEKEEEEEKQLPDKINSEKEVSSIMIQVGNPGEEETKKSEKEEEKPHEEIQLLKDSFKDMINEVKELKESICSIQKEQVKTCSVLQEKDSNLEKLATEIKNLSQTKHSASKKIANNPADVQNYKPPKMESKPKLNHRNRSNIGGGYGLTPKKKCDNNYRRHQYKVISSPQYDPSAIHIFENGRRVLGSNADIDRCISNVISDF